MFGIPTLRDYFRRIGIRRRHWQINFPFDNYTAVYCGHSAVLLIAVMLVVVRLCCSVSRQVFWFYWNILSCFLSVLNLFYIFISGIS